MDSKILCISLLFGVFCLWSTEASPLEGLTMDHSTQDAMDLNMQKGAPEWDNYRSEVKSQTAERVQRIARIYANKAKAMQGHANLLMKVARDRFFYSKQYTKLADDAKRMSMDIHQQYLAQSSRIGPHNARQKDWESKSREADTACKDHDLAAQQEFSKAQESRRNSEVAAAASGMHEGQAVGLEKKSDLASDLAKQYKRLGDTLVSLASKYYSRGKDLESRATSEKVKAHQNAEVSQRHQSANRAYQQEALRTRLAARTNMGKYIENTLNAERHNNYAREEHTKSELEDKSALEFVNMANQYSSIFKILSTEWSFASTHAKEDQTKALTYRESSREIRGTTTTEGGSLLKMSEAKDEGQDVESMTTLPVYSADDSIKAMPSDDKESLMYADEGV